jgi:hypothetical protein
MWPFPQLNIDPPLTSTYNIGGWETILLQTIAILRVFLTKGCAHLTGSSRCSTLDASAKWTKNAPRHVSLTVQSKAMTRSQWLFPCLSNQLIFKKLGTANGAWFRRFLLCKIGFKQIERRVASCISEGSKALVQGNGLAKGELLRRASC